MVYHGRLTRAGIPDLRTKEGRAWMVRSEAAKRGWKTWREAWRKAARIVQERHQRRSEAAKKGWETRRAQKRHQRRSEVAKKGWETRRFPIEPTEEIIIEEPIETVGGPRSGTAKRRKR